jgi:hypothetical protein
MNLATMISGVRDRLPETTANAWTDAGITRWLNDGQNQVVIDLVPEALVGNASTTGLIAYASASMASNVASFAMGASTERYLAVAVQYGGQTAYVQARQVPVGSVRFDSTSPADCAAFGVTIQNPIWWTERTGVQVRPGANLATCAVSTVRLVQPVALSATSDTSLIPATYHHLVVEYAVHVAKRLEREYAESQQVYGIYRDGIDRVNARYTGTQGQNERRATAAPTEVG